MSVEDVEWIGDTDERDRDDWRIDTDEQADWALRLMAAADTEIARLKDREKAELARVKERAAALRARHEETRTRMRRFLEDYLVRLDKRSWRGMCGTVSRTKGARSFEVDDLEAFVAWALPNEPDLVKTSFAVDRDAARWATFNVDPDTGTVFDGMGTGETVPGVRIVTGPDGVRITKAQARAEIDNDGRPQ